MRLSLARKGGCVIVDPLSREENRQVRDFQARVGDQSRVVPDIISRAYDMGLWFACHCQPAGGEHPLVAPFRSKLGNYSLRVLVKSRRLHHSKCPFTRPLSEARLKHAWYRQPRKKPKGLFAVLKPKQSEGQAAVRQASSGESGRRSAEGVSRASQQLLRLLDDARLNRYSGKSDERHITKWREKIKQATTGKNIAPRRSLSNLWLDYPKAWTNQWVHDRLERAIPAWPKNHEPQAFICLLARRFEDRETGILRCSGRVDLGCRVTMREIYGQEVQGPYLVIGVVGRAEAGVQCIEAYAQPVVSARIPIPVDSQFERRAFFSLRQRLAQVTKEYPGSSFEVEKPLFEKHTDKGPCVPDFLIHLRGGGPKVTIVLEVMGLTTHDYYRSKQETHPRMAERGTLLLMDATRFPPTTKRQGIGSEGPRIIEQIRRTLSAKWPR